MYRAIIVAALGLLIAPLDADAESAHIHHVTPIAGVSLDVPDGFTACDVVTNRALGNASSAKASQVMCKELTGSLDAVAMLNLDPNAPLFVVLFRSGNYDFPEEMLSQATPGMVAVFNEEACEKILKRTIKLDTCSVHAGTIGGLGALAAEGMMSQASGSPALFKSYLFSRGTGLEEIFFATPKPISPKALALIDRISASVTIERAPPPQPPTFATLAVMPGITLSIPKGWRSCNAAFNAQLGNAEDHFGNGKKYCAGPIDSSEIRFFSPRLPNAIYLALRTDPTTYSERDLADSLTPEGLSDLKRHDCQLVTEGHAAVGGTTNFCDVTAGKLGGHPAKVVTARSVLNRGGVDAHDYAKTFVAIVDDHFVTLTISASSVFEPQIDTAAESVVNSITFQ